VIARITPYRVSPDAVAALVDEVVDVARRRSSAPVEPREMVAEFFFVNAVSGECLSLVIGHDPSIAPVIDFAEHDGSPEELSVNLLQLGGPRDRDVVDALLGRVVRCPSRATASVSFNGDAIPSSPAIWARALLSGESGDVVAVAVGTDPERVQDALGKLSARCPVVADYDVVYLFWRE